jgi:hypothetical protein
LGLSVGESSFGAEDADQVLETLAFGGEDAAAQPGKPVIASALVVSGRQPAGGFFDEIGLDQALESAVKRGGPESDFAARAVQDFLHDGGAVLVLVGKGEEDMEPVGLKGEEVFGRRHIYID